MDSVEEHYIVEMKTRFYPPMRYSYDRLLRNEVSGIKGYVWSDPIESIRIVRIRKIDGHYRTPVTPAWFE